MSILPKANSVKSNTSFPSFQTSHEISNLNSQQILKNSPLNNKNNNHSMECLPQKDNPAPPDYRAMLLMKRNNSKRAWHWSDESDDSEYSDEDSSQNDAQSLSTDASDSVSHQMTVSDESCASSMSEVELLSAKDGVEPTANHQPLRLGTSDAHALLKISVIDQKLTKCLQVNVAESVWAAKQRIIQSLAKKLTDPLNYGFFCKKLGNFLLDHKPVSDYIEAKSVAAYELRYKQRVYNEILQSSKESRRLKKMQGPAKRKELMRYVRQHNIDKIQHLLKKGVDPNFNGPPSGETPLTLAVSSCPPLQNGAITSELSSLISCLARGGAHLDFRNQHGLTPIHVAVRAGNVSAVQTLLQLGASPDAPDSNDLSPLYHCSLLDASVDCMTPLVQGGAKFDCTNSQGWTLVHQVCRYGRLAHLQVLLDIIASSKDHSDLINAQNVGGNTALHVCVLYNQEQCLLTLLKRNADVTIRNYSHQDAFQVAIVARNVCLAHMIKDFPTMNEQEIAMLMHQRDSSTKTTETQLSSSQRRHTFTAATLAKSELGKTVLNKFETSKVKKHSTIKYDSHLPANATLPLRSAFDPMHGQPQTTLQDIAESPVSTNVPIDGFKEDDNDSVTSETHILYIASSEYESIGDDYLSVQPGDKVTAFKGETDVASVKSEASLPRSSSSAEDDASLSLTSSNIDKMLQESGDVSVRKTSHPNIFHRHREVTLTKGGGGYGFVLRGAKADGPIENFSSTARQPGLQYLESVEVGSNAFRVGLRAGDFILKINTVDVTCMGHKQTVEVIRRLKVPLRLHVVTVLDRTKESSADESSVSLISSKSSSSSHDVGMASSMRQYASPKEKLMRSGSVGSAIGKLDSVLAQAEMSDDSVGTTNADEGTATLRRRPISRRFLSQDGQDVFRQDLQTPSNKCTSQTVSAATSRRLIRVLPPKLPTTESDITEDVANQQAHSSTIQSSGLNRHNSFTSGGARNHSQPLSTSPGNYDATIAAPVKVPPAPPQRRTSRLTRSPSEEKDVHATVKAYSVPTVPNSSSIPPTSPVTPTATQSLGRASTSGPVRPDLSGIAAAAAVQAARRDRLSSSENYGKMEPITHHLVPKLPPPAVARKPSRGRSDPPSPQVNGEPSSAFSIALAAKNASLRQRSQSEVARPAITSSNWSSMTVQASVHKANDNAKATPEETKELMQLPPPPPAPSSQVPYNLPPPPPPSEQEQLPLDQMILPPPPDSMLEATIPPPAGFTGNQTSKPKSVGSSVSKFKGNHGNQMDRITSSNGLDNSSNADSGVDDIGPRSRDHSTENKANVDNLSVVSSLSTISSEDGSDPGVSMSYDHKSTAEPSNSVGNMYLDVLKKNKSSASSATSSASSSIVLNKVSFTQSRAEEAKTAQDVPSTTRWRSGSGAKKSETINLNPSNKTEPPATSDVSTASSKPVPEWTVDDVGKWLTELGLAVHVKGFAENEIQGSHLADLEREDLQELGVTLLGHRKTIERSLKKLLGK